MDTKDLIIYGAKLGIGVCVSVAVGCVFGTCIGMTQAGNASKAVVNMAKIGGALTGACVGDKVADYTVDTVAESVEAYKEIAKELQKMKEAAKEETSEDTEDISEDDFTEVEA